MVRSPGAHHIQGMVRRWEPDYFQKLVRWGFRTQGAGMDYLVRRAVTASLGRLPVAPRELVGTCHDSLTGALDRRRVWGYI